MGNIAPFPRPQALQDMRRPIVAGNWKMNGTRASASELAGQLAASVDGTERAEIVVCPPYVLLPAVAQVLAGTPIRWGGQDLSVHGPGAFTGDVAAEMLADVGCTYCIVGHSERRTHHGESSEVVAEKFARARACGLIPVLCIGETLEQRQRGDTETVLEQQVDAVLDRCGIQGFADAVVAYEPVWAIGTGQTASPAQAQQVHEFVRGKLRAVDAEIAQGLRIQYGGSVKAGNAEDLFRQDDIDGGLIGGASLQAAEFLAICRAA